MVHALDTQHQQVGDTTISNCDKSTFVHGKATKCFEVGSGQNIHRADRLTSRQRTQVVLLVILVYPRLEFASA